METIKTVDPELIDLADVPIVQGPESFDTFYRSQYRPVLGLAIVLTGSKAAAEEITQDAFLAAYRSWEKIGRYEKPEAWVRKVVSNRSVSRFRKTAAERRATERHERTGERSIDPIEDLDADLWDAVRDLPKRQAQSIALTYLLGLPRREVADTLGCSEETVKTHLHRARRTLATRLDAERSHRGH